MPFFGGLHLRALAPCKTNSALALAAAWFLDGICVRFLNRTQVSGWKAGRFGTDELRPLGKRFLNGLIRIPLFTSAFDIGCGADGFDEVGVEGGLSPGVGRGVHQGRVVLVIAVGPIVASQIMPQVLDGIEFR